jgi:hypothetical protein
VRAESALEHRLNMSQEPQLCVCQGNLESRCRTCYRLQALIVTSHHLDGWGWLRVVDCVCLHLACRDHQLEDAYRYRYFVLVLQMLGVGVCIATLIGVGNTCRYRYINYTHIVLVYGT